MKALKFIKENIPVLAVLAFSAAIFMVNARINVFRYNNFDYGKFDLGNMSQMLWNTLHGRFMYLTDYFGTNLPRWAMSHVDPILLLFIPIFLVKPHPMTLVFAQLALVIFSSLLVYLIAVLELKSKVASAMVALAYVAYPALGFLTSWTAFHGVSVAIPFFFGSFYVFELMHKQSRFTPGRIAIFFVLVILTMAGKEQLALYIAFYALFILLFRTPVLATFRPDRAWFASQLHDKVVRLVLWLLGISILWFSLVFFVIIPHYATYRVRGYERFVESLGLESADMRNASLPNYFLSRYDAFGDSYVQVFLGALRDPNKTIQVFFGGDKLDNFNRTFAPVAYLPFLAPQLLVIALPDFLINYLTSAGGIGTSEIYNHRISMIIPIMFISVIYAISAASSFGARFIKKKKPLVIVFSGFVLVTTIYTSFKYNNPVFLWFSQAIQKRAVFAKTDNETAKLADLKVGDIFRLSRLENKDRECALKIIDLVPPEVSVSGPDYLGAHLALRETYAIFPALYNEADYVIVDVFSRKILTILDLDISLARNVVEDLIKNPNYQLEAGCGNLFMFKKVATREIDNKLPLQERFEYPEKLAKELFQSLYIVDFSVPTTIKKGTNQRATFVYNKKEAKSLDEYVLFMTFINTRTGEMYQAANLPSFAILEPRDWKEGRYYIETVDLALPSYLAVGRYKMFIGMSNNVRTRSMYLGDVEVVQ